MRYGGLNVRDAAFADLFGTGCHRPCFGRGSALRVAAKVPGRLVALDITLPNQPIVSADQRWRTDRRAGRGRVPPRQRIASKPAFITSSAVCVRPPRHRSEQYVDAAISGRRIGRHRDTGDAKHGRRQERHRGRRSRYKPCCAPASRRRRGTDHRARCRRRDRCACGNRKVLSPIAAPRRIRIGDLVNRPVASTKISRHADDLRAHRY